MAQLTVNRTLGGILSLVTVVTFLFLLAFATATTTAVGGILYILALAAIVIPMAAKEDALAALGIVGLNLLVILDVYMHIGWLATIWGGASGH